MKILPLEEKSNPMIFIRTEMHSFGLKTWVKVAKSKIPNHRLQENLEYEPRILHYLGATADSYGTIYEYFIVNEKWIGSVEFALNNWRTQMRDKKTASSLLENTHRLMKGG